MSCSALAAPVRVPGTRVAGARPAAAFVARRRRPRASADDVYDVVVVGAGVSDRTAFTLGRAKPDAKMLVTEARDCVGGNITSRSDDRGYVWEEGPNSYQPGDPILTVACDAGMRDDILLADPNSDRYVLWDKELRALPKDIPTAVLGTFLTWPGKIRAGLGAIGIRPPARGEGGSVKEFVSRSPASRRSAPHRTLLPGVYAGDPAMLSSVAARAASSASSPSAGRSSRAPRKKKNGRTTRRRRRGSFETRLPAVEGQTVGSFGEASRLGTSPGRSGPSASCSSGR